MKHVDPKFNRPRKPIVVNELTYRRRGYCNNASILLLVEVHGLHEMLLFKLLFFPMRCDAIDELNQKKRTLSVPDFDSEKENLKCLPSLFSQMFLSHFIAFWIIDEISACMTINHAK